MRYSKQRQEILDIVQHTDMHPTADQIYEDARKQIPNISLGTVYRNLGQLVDKHLIRAYQFDGVVHYDGKMDDHQHFYCTNCHAIYDIDIATFELNTIMDGHGGHQVRDYHLYMTGICEKCQ